MSETKGEARDARLSLRKTNEEVLRKKFQATAAKNCHEEVVSFGKCAEANGIWVVFQCRSQSAGMNRCMDKYYNEQSFQQYLKENVANSSTNKS